MHTAALAAAEHTHLLSSCAACGPHTLATPPPPPLQNPFSFRPPTQPLGPPLATSHTTTSPPPPPTCTAMYHLYSSGPAEHLPKVFKVGISEGSFDATAERLRQITNRALAHAGQILGGKDLAAAGRTIAILWVVGWVGRIITPIGMLYVGECLLPGCCSAGVQVCLSLGVWSWGPVVSLSSQTTNRAPGHASQVLGVVQELAAASQHFLWVLRNASSGLCSGHTRSVLACSCCPVHTVLTLSHLSP